MINGLVRVKCDGCYDYGVVFYGDEDNYHVEPCPCVADEQGI